MALMLNGCLLWGLPKKINYPEMIIMVISFLHKRHCQQQRHLVDKWWKKISSGNVCKSYLFTVNFFSTFLTFFFCLFFYSSKGFRIVLRHVPRIPKDLAFPLTLKVFDQILGLTKYFGDLFCFRCVLQGGCWGHVLVFGIYYANALWGRLRFPRGLIASSAVIVTQMDRWRS